MSSSLLMRGCLRGSWLTCILHTMEKVSFRASCLSFTHVHVTTLSGPTAFPCPAADATLDSFLRRPAPRTCLPDPQAWGWLLRPLVPRPYRRIAAPALASFRYLRGPVPRTCCQLPAWSSAPLPLLLRRPVPRPCCPDAEPLVWAHSLRAPVPRTCWPCSRASGSVLRQPAPSPCHPDPELSGLEARLLASNSCLEALLLGASRTWTHRLRAGPALSPRSCGTESARRP
eukprot:scaffold965_cov262-Pinguiococcus_pyrenoidosus.AAC.22